MFIHFNLVISSKLLAKLMKIADAALTNAF